MDCFCFSGRIPAKKSTQSTASWVDFFAILPFCKHHSFDGILAILQIEVKIFFKMLQPQVVRVEQIQVDSAAAYQPDARRKI